MLLLFVTALAAAEEVFAQGLTPEQRTQMHVERLVQYDPVFRQSGALEWLTATGHITWAQNGIEARQVEEETRDYNGETRILASGLQVRVTDLSVTWPACFTTDSDDVPTGPSTRVYQPDLRNPSKLWTNVQGFTGTATVYISCYEWAQIDPEMGTVPEATQYVAPTQAPPPATAVPPAPTQAPPQPTPVFDPGVCPDQNAEGARLDEAASVLAGECKYGAPPAPTPLPTPVPPPPEPEGFWAWLAGAWGWLLAVFALIATVVAAVVAFVLSSLGVVAFSLLCCLLPLVLLTILVISRMRRR